MLAQYSLQILVIESSANDVESLLNVLRQGGFAITSRRIRNASQLKDALSEREWDVLLCATNADGVTFQEACAGLADANAELAVVVVYDGETDDPRRRVVESLRLGAADAVDKDNPDHLELVLGRELAHLSERRTARQWRHSLDERDRHWQGLLEASRDPIAYVHGGMHIHANPMYLNMFGFDTFEELESLPVLDLVVTEDHGRLKDLLRDEGDSEDHDTTGTRSLEIGALRADGDRIDITMEISAGTFEGEACWQVIIRTHLDDTDSARELEYLRQHDPLTGLCNREYFMASVEAALAGAAESGAESRALLYAELDDFNVLRESAGIAGGDRAIKQIAALFSERLPSRFQLARFGESAFAVLVEGASLRAAMEIAERLRSCLDQRILDVDGGTVSTTCSIGLCTILDQNRGTESVLAEAQRMARAAHKNGGNRVEVQSVSTSQAARQANGVTTGPPTVQIALEEGKLALLYQPIINLREASMELYEVKLGRIDRNGATVATDNLFDTELESSLLRRVDEWLIDQTMQVLASQVEAGRDAHFFLRLSEQSLVDEQTLLFIGKKLRAAQVAGSHLILEISETAAISQVRSVKAFIKGLKDLQCLSALQDFGSGLNSTNTLKVLEVDYFKIAPALVQSLAVSPESQSAVRSIVETALSLDKRAIAAGVEEAATLAMLWDIGVHYAQGNGIRAPSPELEWDFEASELGG